MLNVWSKPLKIMFLGFFRLEEIYYIFILYILDQKRLDVDWFNKQESAQIHPYFFQDPDFTYKNKV